MAGSDAHFPLEPFDKIEIIVKAHRFADFCQRKPVGGESVDKMVDERLAGHEKKGLWAMLAEVNEKAEDQARQSCKKCLGSAKRPFCGRPEAGALLIFLYFF